MSKFFPFPSDYSANSPIHYQHLIPDTTSTTYPLDNCKQSYCLLQAFFIYCRLRTTVQRVLIAIMPRLQELLTAFTLIFSIVHAITPDEYEKGEFPASPAQVEQGRIPGFVGSVPVLSIEADWMETTFCYCAAPRRLHKTVDEGHYYQVIYYNHHRNVTFIMDNLCLLNHADDATCVQPDNAETADDDADPENGAMFCKQWTGPMKSEEGKKTNRVGDRMCYTKSDYLDVPKVTPTGVYKGLLQESIIFNGQERDLIPFGSQGHWEHEKFEIEAMCETKCQVHCRMPMLKNDRHAKSRWDVYDDMDDMCPTCR